MTPCAPQPGGSCERQIGITSGSCSFKQLLPNTNIVSILCNATQCGMRRGKFNLRFLSHRLAAAWSLRPWLAGGPIVFRLILFSSPLRFLKEPLALIEPWLGFRPKTLGKGCPTASACSVLRLGGVHCGPADDLAHFAGLFGKRAHLGLHVIAMQPQHFGQILGVH